ncbi:MAG TPA: ABC transporter permease [Feifaniaceae bacterium]|nr:ABC transporter permease [Feifaniaceae bacterium]
MATANLSKRLLSSLKTLYFPVIALVASLLIGSLVILFTSETPPLEAYAAMFKGAFGTVKAWDETVVKAVPFIFTALSFAIARRCGIINLGAEGQFRMGALLATIVGVSFPDMPMALHLPLTLLAGFIGGALYGVIVAALKIRFGASELITTIMLNYVAINIIDFAVTGPLKDSASSSYPQSAPIFESAQLPRLFEGASRLHWGFLLMILALFFYYFFLWKTTKGFEMRVVGLNPTAGAYAGMSINRSTLLSMLIAGGFAGLGGCVEIIGIQYRLMQTSFTITYGFTGIAVALMGSNNPLGILLSGVLFGGLQSGSLKMQTLTDVSSSVVLVVQALIILFIAGRSMFQWKTRKRKECVKTQGPSDPTKPIPDEGVA